MSQKYNSIDMYMTFADCTDNCMECDDTNTCLTCNSGFAKRVDDAGNTVCEGAAYIDPELPATAWAPEMLSRRGMGCVFPLVLHLCQYTPARQKTGILAPRHG